MKKLSYEIIDRDTLWVAKMQGYRQVGTYAEVGHLFHDPECRDFDTLCIEGQPEHLREFYTEYFAYCDKECWITIPDYYNKVYNPKKVWTEAQIADLIQTNDTVLYRALKKLYSEQTDAEQDMGETKERNGRGFNGVDSKFLSSVSEFLIKHGFLTSKQKSVTRRMLKKYNKQLTRLANA